MADPNLLVVLIVVLLLVALVMFAFVSLANKGLRSLPYERCEHFLSPAEQAFLRVLDEAVEGDYRVFSKVRLADVIRPTKGLSPSERTTRLNQISSKHIDFVLCDPESADVVCVVELDDASHRRSDRQRRDEFLDAALLAAGMPIVHVRAQKSYNRDTVRKQIDDAIGEVKV